MVKPLNAKPNILERRRLQKQKAARGGRELPKATSKPIEKGQNKGYYLGACNRSACLAPGASWYNHGSLAYYCGNCARELSNDSFNKRQSLLDWGHDLCTPGKYNREVFDLSHEQHTERLRNMLGRHSALDLAKIPTGTLQFMLDQEIAADTIKIRSSDVKHDFMAWMELMREQIPDFGRHTSPLLLDIQSKIYQEYARGGTVADPATARTF